MPKEKESKGEFCSRMTSQYKGILRTDKSILFCVYCNCSITGCKSFNVKQHFETKKHKLCAERRAKNSESQLLMKESVENKYNSFSMDLCKMFVSANIPLEKVNHPAVIEFLERYTTKSVPSTTNLRTKYVPALYEKVLEKMRVAVGDNYIWISIDETTDVEQRLIANFVFGILDGTKESAEKSYLLNAGVVDAANANTMAAFINDSLHILWPNGIQYNKVLFTVTDAAAYMLATMKAMKTLYPKMLHCTCFAHGVHRIAEFVRLEFKDVNALISNVKSIYCKAPSRRRQFKTDFPELKLPPQPCITRWGTWIDAAEYYCAYLNEVRSAINKFSNDDSDVIRRTKELIENNNLKNDLTFIKSNFGCLSAGIEKLQAKGLTLKEGFDVIEVVRQSLTQIEDKRFLEKLNAVLKRNEGYTSLCKIKRIIFNNSNENDDYTDSLTASEIANFKYCPVTSVDVERSFSVYGTLLTEKRRSFLFENLMQHLIVHCNFWLLK